MRIKELVQLKARSRCAILNVTEAKKNKEDKKGGCAIIDVTEAKGALSYGKQIKKRVFG